MIFLLSFNSPPAGTRKYFKRQKPQSLEFSTLSFIYSFLLHLEIHHCNSLPPPRLYTLTYPTNAYVYAGTEARTYLSVAPPFFLSPSCAVHVPTYLTITTNAAILNTIYEIVGTSFFFFSLLVKCFIAI